MRRVNVILSVTILVLVLLHAILGSFQMLGVGQTALKHMARFTFALICVHAGIGVKLAIDSKRIAKQSGVDYQGANRLFWARRDSGFAMMLFLVLHLFAFADRSSTAYRLVPFTTVRLILQILLVVTLAVHLLLNVKPLLIGLGIRDNKRFSLDLLLVLSVLLAFTAVAFLLYYLRWMRL